MRKLDIQNLTVHLHITKTFKFLNRYILEFLCLTCKDVAAPIRSPSDCATREVWVAKVRNIMKRLKSFGCDVIQYTILPYTSGNII